MNSYFNLSTRSRYTLLMLALCSLLSACGASETASTLSERDSTPARRTATTYPTASASLQYPCAYNPQMMCPPGKGANPEAELRAEAEQAQFNPTVPPPTALPGTPVPLGFIPPSAQQIYTVNPDSAADGPVFLRGGNSMWHIGAIPSGNPDEYCDVYVLARQPRSQSTPTTLVEEVRGRYATLATGLMCNAISQDLAQTYIQIWEAPQAVGVVTITNVTEVTLTPSMVRGVVAFTTSSGKAGTFDLATHSWSFSR